MLERSKITHCKAVMAGLTRIMKLAYNRLISLGLPPDAPAIVVEWDELKARPRVLEKISTWAEQAERLDPAVDLSMQQANC